MTDQEIFRDNIINLLSQQITKLSENCSIKINKESNKYNLVILDNVKFNNFSAENRYYIQFEIPEDGNTMEYLQIVDDIINQFK